MNKLRLDLFLAIKEGGYLYFAYVAIWKTSLLGVSSGNCNEACGRLRLEKSVRRQQVLVGRVV